MWPDEDQQVEDLKIFYLGEVDNFLDKKLKRILKLTYLQISFKFPNIWETEKENFYEYFLEYSGYLLNQENLNNSILIKTSEVVLKTKENLFLKGVNNW